MVRRRPAARKRTPLNRRIGAATSVPAVFNHRTYPERLTRAAPGHCRWCGTQVLRDDGRVDYRRGFCGQLCVTAYLLRADPAVMRRHVFFRDDGICGECGKQWRYMDDPWDADHILPLFLAFGDPDFWEPENVTVLCRDPCHRKKSAEDMQKYGFALKLAKGAKATEDEADG